MLTESQLTEQIGKITPIGTAIVVISNVVSFAIGSMVGKDHVLNSSNKLIGVILLIVAAMDIIAGLLVKKKMLEPLLKPQAIENEPVIYQTMIKTMIIIAAICAAPAIYGLVAVMAGATAEFLAAFLVISLGGFLFLRLRPRDLKSLVNSQFQDRK